MSTKKAMQVQLKERGVNFTTKMTKGQLENLLSKSEGDVKKYSQSPVSETRDQNGKRPKAGSGVKHILYRLFTEDPELVIQEQELIDSHLPGRKVSSIRCWIGKGGLGNEKYAVLGSNGKPDPILITRNRDTNAYSRQS